jgi:hypothetical protein
MVSVFTGLKSGSGRMNLPKPRRILDARYREWIRTKPCWAIKCFIVDLDKLPHCYSLASVDPCAGNIDACHIIPKGEGRTGSKVSDYRTIPGCRHHHEWQGAHPNEYRAFYELLIESLNEEYFQLHPAKEKREQKPRVKPKKLIRAWCVLTPEKTLRFPIFEEYADALNWRATLQERGQIVRVQVRCEGVK